jgi:hypothetical protein
MRALFGLVAAILAGVLGPSAGARAVASCTVPQLRGSVHASSGAAGTVAVSLAFRNLSRTTCTLRGYPGLRLVGAPTRTRHGGLAILARPVRTVLLGPGSYASLLVAYSDVLTGSETSCPTTHALLVTPPGAAAAVRVAVTIGACNRGLLRESPFLGGLRSV